MFSGTDASDVHASGDGTWSGDRERLRTELKLRLSQIATRLERLTDAYIDQKIEQSDYAPRKEELVRERMFVTERLNGLGTESDRPTVADYLELAQHAWLLYKLADPENKRSLVETFTSNRSLSGRNLEVTLAPPFSLIAKRLENEECALGRNRTCISSFAGMCPIH